MDISCASYDELKDILELQRLSYQSEAAMFKEPIPPLKQTLEEVQEEHRTGSLNIIKQLQLIIQSRKTLQ